MDAKSGGKGTSSTEKVNFWKDKEKGLINPDLFSNNADNIAKKLSNNEGKNKSSQTRKFYDEVIMFNRRVKEKPSEFEKILPYLKMLNAKAAYAEGRKLISSDFKDFIKGQIDQINDERDLDVFASFFEAIMGYYKHYNPKD
ncbi:MAG: type III-A CRISPR-associated protein Csm2 [Nitrospirae bacterium]|uniref:type III-A CRISPR-associated protein Csm2 n=1 Tax=Candidatus Magnetobacterium casense TaxID=1455061 RepID=UPI000696A77C|nr:type III-A CRISPR-associated protein Csm2 [Candidatus Magnetobacterium casensis]MBF0337419.1 type III-A CRISPR-associated protein Csm2 [Nitrospirota bacterium]